MINARAQHGASAIGVCGRAHSPLRGPVVSSLVERLLKAPWLNNVITEIIWSSMQIISAMSEGDTLLRGEAGLHFRRLGA